MKPEQLSKYIEIANAQSFNAAFEQAYNDGRLSLVKEQVAAVQNWSNTGYREKSVDCSMELKY
jgi:hypothetical protein